MPKRVLIFRIKQAVVEAGVVIAGGVETAGSDALVTIGAVGVATAVLDTKGVMLKAGEGVGGVALALAPIKLPTVAPVKALEAGRPAKSGTG